jgi:hypothetical protein
VFITSDLDLDAQKRLAEVKEKMGVLERSLEKDVARLSQSRIADELDNPKTSTLPGQDEGHSDKEDDEDVRNLDPSYYATQDAAYYDDDVNNDDVVDLGIAMGKVRITERIGGLVRPRLSEEVSLPQALSNASSDTYPSVARPGAPGTSKKRPHKPHTNFRAGSARMGSTQPRLPSTFVQFLLCSGCREDIADDISPVKNYGRRFDGTLLGSRPLHCKDRTSPLVRETS